MDGIPPTQTLFEVVVQPEQFHFLISKCYMNFHFSKKWKLASQGE